MIYGPDFSGPYVIVQNLKHIDIWSDNFPPYVIATFFLAYEREVFSLKFHGFGGAAGDIFLTHFKIQQANSQF